MDQFDGAVDLGSLGSSGAKQIQVVAGFAPAPTSITIQGADGRGEGVDVPVLGLRLKMSDGAEAGEFLIPPGVALMLVAVMSGWLVEANGGMQTGTVEG